LSISERVLPQGSPLPELVTVTQAARWLGIGRSTLYGMVANGQVPVQKFIVGRTTRLSRRQLAAWLRAGIWMSWPRQPRPLTARAPSAHDAPRERGGVVPAGLMADADNGHLPPGTLGPWRQLADRRLQALQIQADDGATQRRMARSRITIVWGPDVRGSLRYSAVTPPRAPSARNMRPDLRRCDRRLTTAESTPSADGV
jgi:excisionase family DNA binding protein